MEKRRLQLPVTQHWPKHHQGLTSVGMGSGSDSEMHGTWPFLDSSNSSTKIYMRTGTWYRYLVPGTRIRTKQRC